MSLVIIKVVYSVFCVFNFFVKKNSLLSLLYDKIEVNNCFLVYDFVDLRLINYLFFFLGGKELVIEFILIKGFVFVLIK